MGRELKAAGLLVLHGDGRANTAKIYKDLPKMHYICPDIMHCITKSQISHLEERRKIGPVKHWEEGHRREGKNFRSPISRYVAGHTQV